MKKQRPARLLQIATLPFVLVTCGGVAATGPPIPKLREGERGGHKECTPFVDPYPADEARTSEPSTRAAEYFASREGCACAGGYGEDQICAGFPCTKDGCYVKRCRGDADCRSGLCSSHASGPHGYCVRSDPH